MSGEFGSYTSGYFHWQMRQAADDCLGGGHELTKLWGAFLKEFDGVAYAIAYSEAGDSTASDTIMECIKVMPMLKAKLNAVEDYLKPFQAVAEAAVYAAMRSKEVEKQA